MATNGSQRPQSRATESFADYIPDNFDATGDLFTDDEQADDRNKKAKDDGTEGLGIDKELSLKKRVREPRVKLDESRLLSEKGIPALRQRARVLNLKGKGHEFSDASRLLSMYQLWLDDLFPKARFADALVMVEKEGHKTGMHKMRTEWINESKPRDLGDEIDVYLAQNEALVQSTTQTAVEKQAPVATAEIEVMDSTPDDLFDDDDFDYPSLLPPTSGLQTRSVGFKVANDVPDDNELDALMEEAMEVHQDVPNGLYALMEEA